MEKLNVAIADDNERIVQLLENIVKSDKDLEVVGKAGGYAVHGLAADGGDDALFAVHANAPFVIGGRRCLRLAPAIIANPFSHCQGRRSARFSCPFCARVLPFFTII